VSRNSPVIANLASTLDQALALASAIADNCWDDAEPLAPDVAVSLDARITEIQSQIAIARNWSRSEAQPAGLYR
jgi:hypothetical protein